MTEALLPAPSSSKQKCLYELPNIPRGAKPTMLRTTALEDVERCMEMKNSVKNQYLYDCYRNHKMR